MIPFPMATVMQLTGESATYTPLAGSPVTCKAKRVMPANERRFGEVRVVAKGATVYHLLRSEIPAPAIGATLAVGGDTVTIDAVDPLESDPQELLWEITAGWGVVVSWSRKSGTTSEQRPPMIDGPTIAAALIGAASVDIPAQFVVGDLESGDTFTVAGDATTYTVQAAVTAGTSGFTGVTISPALAKATTGAEAVTFTFVDDGAVDIRVALGDYEAQEILGGVTAGDRRLVVRHEAVTASGRADIQTGDVFEIDGEVWRVVSARRVYEGATVAAWEAQVRR